MQYLLKNIYSKFELNKIWTSANYILVQKKWNDDVVIAKNYLSKEELESLELIVSAFLDLAENRAKKHIPMTMDDWSTRIDKFLLAGDLDN